MNDLHGLERTTGDDLLTVDQLSEYLQVPVQTIYAWRHDGAGPKALKAGRALRYRRIEVDRWLARDEGLRDEG